MATDRVRIVTAAQQPAELAAVDHLMLRGDAHPRLRSAFMSVEVLDSTPDWRHFRARALDVSRQVLRLRQKVVAAPLPTGAPRWIVDPDFDVDFHVRRMRVPQPGTLREVFDLAEVLLQSPLDLARPLWTATLVEGLADGRAAALLHMSHAIVDGVGSVKMLAPIYDHGCEPEREPIRPQAMSDVAPPTTSVRQGVDAVAAGVRGVLSTVGRAARNPLAAAAGAVGYARSSARILAPVARVSPLLRERGVATRSEALDVKLADLDEAAKACRASINDVYLAGVCAALGRYHSALGAPVASVPMVVPVSIRTDADPLGGNRFAAVSVAAPVDTADPLERIRKIRAQMNRRRDEPAKGLIGAVAPVLRMLPNAVLVPMMLRTAGASDVLATNIALYPHDTYLCGAKVLRQYALGPLNGTAIEVALVSRGGICTITARYDRAAVPHESLFAECLRAGFDEILALAGEPAPLSVPASFGARDPGSVDGSRAQEAAPAT